MNFPFPIWDRTKETTSSSGTSDFVLSGAVSGFQAFGAKYIDQQVVQYCAVVGAQWETGAGVYNASGNTLSRPAAVEDNSSNTTSKINFSTSPTVFVVATAAVISQIGSQANLLYNGDMIFDQINEGMQYTTSAAAHLLTLDGWTLKASAASIMNGQRVTDAPTGFSYSFKATVATSGALAAGNSAWFQQAIEGNFLLDAVPGIGQPHASGFVLSFWVKSSLTGAFSIALNNSDLSRSYIATYTVAAANTWQYVAIIIPSDMTSWPTFSTTPGLYVYFDLGAGSTFQTSTVNAWQTGTYFEATGTNQFVTNSGATIQFTNVRFRMGTYDVVYIPRPYSAEIAICQRYYAKTFPAGTAVAQSAGVPGALSVLNPVAAGAPSYWWQYPVSMRTLPTIVTYNPSEANANWRDITASADATVSVDPAATKGTDGVLLAMSGTVTTQGDVLGIHATANARLS